MCAERRKMWRGYNNCTFIFVVCKEKCNFAKIITFAQSVSLLFKEVMMVGRMYLIKKHYGIYTKFQLFD